MVKAVERARVAPPDSSFDPDAVAPLSSLFLLSLLARRFFSSPSPLFVLSCNCIHCRMAFPMILPFPPAPILINAYSTGVCPRSFVSNSRFSVVHCSNVCNRCRSPLSIAANNDAECVERDTGNGDDVRGDVTDTTNGDDEDEENEDDEDVGEVALPPGGDKADEEVGEREDDEKIATLAARLWGVAGPPVDEDDEDEEEDDVPAEDEDDEDEEKVDDDQVEMSGVVVFTERELMGFGDEGDGEGDILAGIGNVPEYDEMVARRASAAAPVKLLYFPSFLNIFMKHVLQ